jgi:hypothetical protein
MLLLLTLWAAFKRGQMLTLGVLRLLQGALYAEGRCCIECQVTSSIGERNSSPLLQMALVLRL